MKGKSEELSSDEIFISVDAFREKLIDRIVDQYLRRRYPKRSAPNNGEVD